MTTRRGRGDDLVQLCSFAVGGDLYVIDIMRIKEIINPLPIRRVPKAPHFVEGVVDLRGAIIPIVDVRKRLDVAPAPGGRTEKYVIVTIAGRIVGLVVDAVHEVIRVERGALRPAPQLATDARTPVVTGVCSYEGKILLLLDLDQLLTQAERATLREAGDLSGGPSGKGPA